MNKCYRYGFIFTKLDYLAYINAFFYFIKNYAIVQDILLT